MARALGIDFGEKRIGLALSDPSGRLAVPLETLERKDDRTALAELRRLIEEERVELVVIGEPRNLDGSRGPAAERAASFAAKLAAATGLPCELVDESLTSVEAEERLRAAGGDPRRTPSRVDAIAAQILLQEVLDRRREGA